MSSYRFQRDDDSPAMLAWRPLDLALAQWVRAHGGSDTLAGVAAWASYADGLGDAALPLLGAEAMRHGMLPLSPQAVGSLRAEPLVGDGSRITPFVLDEDGLFALWRNHAHEIAIAAQVRARRVAARSTQAVDLDADVDALFHGRDDAAVRRQRDAVQAVVGRRLFVLTGGPGTGKTTTVLRMLLMRLRRAHAALPSIQVAAPTGKAAQRLVQALREGKRLLGAEGPQALPADWQGLLERIPTAEALTVHRLLGFDPRRNLFARGRERPLAADIVVIDEASMLDLGMLRALLDAVRPEATLILVGDADQLTSVATGSVLMDLVGALERDRAPECVRLQHSFRAEQELALINEAVRAGDASALRDAFEAAAPRAMRLPVGDRAALRRALQFWSQTLAESIDRPLLPALPTHVDDATTAAIDAQRSAIAHAALRTLAQRQLLCALREERYGAVAANAAIETDLKRRWQVPAAALWYPGRAIIVVRNDYAARLFNGDIGLCLADADGTLRVWFEATADDGHASARAIAPGSLPAHESAFAITIHKSQGSEYAHAGVLLPPDPSHRILSRQLLYTGLSRARSELALWASDEVIAAALQRPIVRVGSLPRQLG